ncbi:sugar porter family MFS transporter [Celerinatantimonas sp. MCCC 1A17872]|uniref:sugar porter family MFS transporter n=1 Tax=Celerinatantimonas sp. MCCC 1A17872 TaxID=3177514 RepID=UPI0038C73344
MKTQITTKYNVIYVMAISAVAAIGGLLFGFDSSVISGVIEPMGHHYQLTPSQTGWAVSNVVIGCVIGCLSAGYLSDKFGRKRALVVTAALFIVSILGTAWTNSFEAFVWFRILGGFAIGTASVISPVYIAEVAPRKMRGTAITMHMICCVGGQMVVLITNYLIAKEMSDIQLDAVGWRWMLSSALVPCVLFFILVGFIPETPRWNILNGRDDKALKTLTKISNATHAEQVFKEIKDNFALEAKAALASHSHRQGKFGKNSWIFISIGIGLALFNILTGINVVQYFGPTLMLNITSSLKEAMFMTIFLAALQFCGVIVGMSLIDKVGRTILLKFGSFFAFIFLLYTFVAFYYKFPGWWSVIGLFGFMFTFGVSWAQVVWTVIGEIFPTRLRAIGTGISISAMWAGSFLTTQTFPLMNKSQYLVDKFHGGLPLLIFAVCTLISLVFVKKCVPETKGIALEKMEKVVLSKFNRKAVTDEVYLPNEAEEAK